MFYQYWIVRYVPDPIRGEFVNIALLVGADGHDWAFRQVRHLTRATRLGGDPMIANYWLRELQRMVINLDRGRPSGPDALLTAIADSGENISAGTIARLAARLNNAVQVSAPYPIVADSAQAGVDMLFDHLVADPQVKTRELFSARVTSYVSQEFRHALPRGSNAVIRNRPHVRVGAVPRTANFAVTDSRVEQITNTWSFNLADVEKVSTEIQAWAAHMSRLRVKGGLLESKGRPPLIIPEDVQLRVVYEEPRTEAAKPALDIAREVWDEVPGLVAYPESQRSQLVDDALAVVA